MTLTLREAKPADAEVAGRICYEAFEAISTRHGFPPDLPSAELGIAILSGAIGNPGSYVVVAEQDGQIVGSNVLDERDSIAGIGPITVAPGIQNSGAGRELMLHVMERAQARGCPGTRLVQAAFHSRSLSLYAKLGFDAREPLSCMQGAPIGREVPGHDVRPATDADADACNALCRNVHGHDRSVELGDAIGQGLASVVERDGRVSGYATLLGFFGHVVAEGNADLKALISAAPEFLGPGFLLPTRNAELFRWCLANGLRVVQPMTLMTLGLYNEPAGAYLASVLY
jgi:predicted N-acetyltransferase YhbS